tara:strand:- start:596 stop:835 length:240 start_codon:yes stop_codon:yes gene_type:complete
MPNPYANICYSMPESSNRWSIIAFRNAIPLALFIAGTIVWLVSKAVESVCPNPFGANTTTEPLFSVVYEPLTFRIIAID